MTMTVMLTDSRQLAELRYRYRRDHGNLATPYRLGSYARRQKITIDDFGAHSKRWVNKFRDGFELKSNYKVVKQLQLFNP